ncbi:hypothetical protein [Zophobihabitans entericus]|uniref:Uncharacterized protein n=1 Tax=Zophobihabitans entericus TaxID=1635327 RepID=A0A6G9IB07_9GAMM|nr:hypothetical protein [Zophobihabitans entericus]QIQ21418.1 hypothetical protein IPMB12_06780 [Zophobihabitans entericus]
MLYACECPQYKIFRVAPLISTQPQLKDTLEPLDFTGKDQVVAEAITKAIENLEDNTLIGRDIDLVFHNQEDEMIFQKQVGRNPICYIYYFD